MYIHFNIVPIPSFMKFFLASSTRLWNRLYYVHSRPNAWKAKYFVKALGARPLEGLNRIAKHLLLLFNHGVKLFKDGAFNTKIVMFIFVVGYKYCLHNLINRLSP